MCALSRAAAAAAAGVNLCEMNIFFFEGQRGDGEKNSPSNSLEKLSAVNQKQQDRHPQKKFRGTKGKNNENLNRSPPLHGVTLSGT